MQVGGYLEEYADFTFATVRRAGHEAPYTGREGEAGGAGGQAPPFSPLSPLQPTAALLSLPVAAGQLRAYHLCEWPRSCLGWLALDCLRVETKAAADTRLHAD